MAVKILYYRTLTDTNCVSPVRQIKPLMKNTPVYLTLQWYDAVEEVRVSTEFRA